MQKITVTANAPDDAADPDHDTGLNSDAYNDLLDALMELGYDDVDITRS
jgi:hypothetical protein